MKEKITIFEVYGSDPTYLVRINNCVYEMNENCTQPNGVNMYAGTWSEWEKHCKGIKKLDKIPVILVQGWIQSSEVVEELYS